jgi:hypothetical protein
MAKDCHGVRCRCDCGLSARLSAALSWWKQDYPTWTVPETIFDPLLFTAELLAVNTFETILNERSLWKH